MTSLFSRIFYLGLVVSSLTVLQSQASEIAIAQRDNTSLSRWSAHITRQVFSFNYTDSKAIFFAKLKPFFTDTAWQELLTEFKKSGNLSTIKELRINSSVINKGKVRLIALTSANQQSTLWRATIPVEVVFSSDKFAAYYPMLVNITLSASRNNAQRPKIIHFNAKLSANPYTHYLKPRGCPLRQLP